MVLPSSYEICDVASNSCLELKLIGIELRLFSRRKSGVEVSVLQHHLQEDQHPQHHPHPLQLHSPMSPLERERDELKK